MAVVLKVSNVASINGDQRQEDVLGRRKIGRILESIGKYVVDSAVNLSTKGLKGRMQLHKTVHEELKERVPLKQRTVEGNHDTLSTEEMQAKTDKLQARIDKMQEEMNIVKHKNGVFSRNMEPAFSKKFPPEQLNDKDFLMPNKKKIMIRSRL